MDVRLFLCGDVMTGRGIDQILPHPCAPEIHEPCVQSARDYVRLAEQASGPIPRAVEPSYIWGDGLEELERVAPAARIINLETAVTRSPSWAAKGINYRMSPENVACLAAAHIDCCALANNHVLDWGIAGLAETLDTLHGAGIRTAGAGRTATQAEAPAQLQLGARSRVLVFSLALPSSGVPPSWAPHPGRPGIAYIEELSEESLARVAARIDAARSPGDLVIASVHWGPNWGYDISTVEQRFARGLVDRAGVSILHGHSSHHAKGIEVFHGKLILYGCGDLINDYEGIGGHAQFRGDLSLMYFPTLNAASGELRELRMTAMQMKRFRLCRAGESDARLACSTLAREGRRFGTRAEMQPDGRIELRF
jgi:poly-gamma-glutamate synthesis protein (capsule biosynthesis protein)